MSRLPIYAAATLALGLIAGCLAPAAAHAHPSGVFLDCGARWDFCQQACDYSVPGGPVLGQCYDYCTKGAGVCEASRIPLPVRYRPRSRYPIDRK
jgi:hypothetical protein